MPIDPSSNPIGTDVAMPMIQRPERVSREIANLLATGQVADLYTQHGELLYDLMSADEKDTCHQALPMPTCPNFNGETCDFCLGKTRYRQCGQCHGEAIPVHLRPKRDELGNYIKPPSAPVADTTPDPQI